MSAPGTLGKRGRIIRNAAATHLQKRGCKRLQKTSNAVLCNVLSPMYRMDACPTSDSGCDGIPKCFPGLPALLIAQQKAGSHAAHDSGLFLCNFLIDTACGRIILISRCLCCTPRSFCQRRRTLPWQCSQASSFSTSSDPRNPPSSDPWS